MTCDYRQGVEADQRRAFTVAALMPEARLQVIRQRIDLLLRTAASFHEAKPALERVIHFREGVAQE